MRVRPSFYALLLALAFFALIAVQPAHATLPSPNEPILVVQSSSSTDPYQNFVPELLTTEGLNGFQTAQLLDLTATFLTNYDVVILPHLALTSAEVTLFQNYVAGGGTLIGFRPDLQLATTFGVASLASTLPEAWLKISTTTSYAPNGASNVLRFHGTADLYSLNGATAIANLYNSPALPTTSPAVSVYTNGSGTAILFSFDLTQSVVLMRQGNPAWAGYPNNHDGFNTMRASQMFMDQNTDTFWNDLGDGALNDVPQADIEMRLFSNALTLTNAAKLPLPRLWYYPNQSRSLVLMTADDHSLPVADALAEFNFISSYGGQFSYNLWYPYGTVSNTQVNTWLAAGNTMAIHYNDTLEMDSSGVGGSQVTWNGMQAVMTSAQNSFPTTYPSAPVPTTTRNHYLIWVSNDANGTVDQVAQAKLFQNNGIQLDTSYSSFPSRWGYMTGSGLPMKFLDTVAGTVIPVYEQATQYEDDIQLETTAYGLDWSLSTAQGHYVQTLSDSLNKYNTVTTFLFHPENWSNFQSYAQAALQYAQTNSVPMTTTGSWLTFWKARSATTFSMPSFTSNVLAFTATGSPAGLTLQVPEASGTNKVVSTFKVDSVSQSFTVGNYQGVEQASVTLTAGTHNISVTYVAAGRILGQITPSAAAASSTVQVQSGSFTETASVASNGTFVIGPLPAGTYTVTPSSTVYSFSPTSQSVDVDSADVTGVNFTATANPAGQTLFTTQTPVVTNASDGSKVNYELGTAFTSSVAGQITAVRFWKASSETGTHTGHIWSSTGTSLGSVVFTNETASGWQQQALTAPITIAANTTYIVSVNTAGTYYVDTSGGLASQVVNGNLASVVGNNGLYGSSGTFPTSSYNSTNYFRDIVFAIAPTYTVSGSVLPASSGVGTTLTLSGSASATTSADSNGNYSFSGLLAGSYTVTPSKNGYTFSPTSAPATVSTGNVTVTTFTPTAVPTYTVSGSITGTTGTATTVALIQNGTTISIDNSVGSSYSFSGVAAGNYTVTPSNPGYTFSPPSAAANVTTGNLTVTTFVATVGAPGQSLFTSQTPVVTNASDGPTTNYELGMSFTSTAAGQITAVRFYKATSESGTHTGRIWSSTGTQLGSVVFTNETASGWQQQALATPISIAANTTYVVSVNTGSSYYVYTTSGLATQIVNGNLKSVVGSNGLYGSTGTFPTSSYQNSNYFRDVVFVLGPTYTISGTVPTVNSGATITLTGSATATTTANTSGSYSFTGLVAGSYTVTPTMAGYTFSPTSAQVSVTTSNVTVAAFTSAAVPTYTVSGSITGTTGTGTTVTLTLGTTTVATATSVGSSYSFTGVAAGNYTVTPTSSAYTFNPTSAPANVTTGNVTVATFAGTAVPPGQSLFTTQTPTVTNASDGSGVNYELGTSFTSTAAGQITAVRFYKSSSESGTHTGRIWSSTGTQLGSVVFTNETASGWQQQTLTTPISIAANTTYVVSVNTGNTYYVATAGGLSTQVVNGYLKSVVGNNGLYGTTGTFPTGSYQGSNYFRDVVFVVGPTYTVSGSVSPAITGVTTTLTLSGSATATTTAGSNGAYSFTGLLAGSYTVTPSAPGYTFSPTNASTTVTTSNVTVTTFTPTAVPTFTVSGSITGTGGNAATVTLTLSGATIATATANASGVYSFANVAAGNYTVTPSNSGFTFTPASAPANVTTANVTVATFAAAGQTLFTTQIPTVTNASDGAGANYELGMSFTSSAAGQITAIRFYKATSESGTHTGHIWSSTGTSLGTVTFTNETASGWQQQALATPITIAANTTYVVSVNTGNTYYVATDSGLSSKITNGDLSSVVGNNGLYSTTTGTFPTSSYLSSNYFRDIVFVPGS